MKQLLGEALTLRALHYIDLINMWGDVPARLTSLNADNMYSGREDRDVIYKQLIIDLQEAQDLCAWPNEIDATKTVEQREQSLRKRSPGPAYACKHPATLSTLTEKTV